MGNDLSKEVFSSRLSGLLVIIMSSLGLGNIWRFPYLCAEYGGAAFVVIYLISIVFIVVIGNHIEISMGKFSRKGVIGAYTAIGQRRIWRIVGFVTLFINTIVYVYYNVMIGWIARYFAGSFNGSVWKAESPEAYFDVFIDTPSVIPWVLAVNFVIFGVLWKGLNKGLEMAAKIVGPILFVIMIIMIIRTLTLPNIGEGLAYYLKPDWNYFFQYETWVQAIGQGLWSGIFGYGVITVMGSYMRKKDDAGSMIIQTGLLDAGISWMMGLAIIPACVALGVDLKSGTSLGFLIIPEMLEGIPGGQLFLILFYGALTIAGIGCAIGGVEATLVPLAEEWGYTRKQVVPFLFVLWNLAALPCMLSKNVLDWVDITVGSMGFLLGGLFFFIFGGWCWGAKRLRTNVLNVGADIPFGGWWDIMAKFISPGLIIFACYGFFKAFLIPYVSPVVTWVALIIIVGFNVIVFTQAVRHPVPENIGDLVPCEEPEKA